MKFTYLNKGMPSLAVPGVGRLQDGRTYELPESVAKQLKADYPQCAIGKDAGGQAVKPAPVQETPSAEERAEMARLRAASVRPGPSD